MKKKLFTLLTLLLCLCSGAWASTENLTKASSDKTAVSGTSYTTSANMMTTSTSNNFIKVRTNMDNPQWTFNVNPGYKITGIKVEGYSNNNLEVATITMLTMCIDNGESILTGSDNTVFPTGSANAITLDKSGFEATSKITCTFDNSNITTETGRKNAQLMVKITFTYEEVGGVTVAPTITLGNDNKVTLASATSGAAIYYTIDGTDPSYSTTKETYSNPFTLENTCTVRAIAIKGEVASIESTRDCYISHPTALSVLGYKDGTREDATKYKWTSNDGNYVITMANTEREMGYVNLAGSQDGFKLNHVDTYTITPSSDIKVSKIVVVGKSWLQKDGGNNASTIAFDGFTPTSGTFFEYPTDGVTYVKTIEFTPTTEQTYGQAITMRPGTNQLGAYIEIYGVKRSGPADPVVVGGETITWDLSSADAWTVALKGGTFSAPSSDSEDPIRNTLYNTNQSKTITYVAGKNDSKTNTHIAPNGSTKTNARYVVLQISKDGTLGLTTNGNEGAFVVRKAANATTTWGEATDYSTTVSITTSTAGTEVTGSITYDSEKPYILIGFPDGKRNIQKITWTPASDNIELTTTDNMAGWRAFNPDGQGYTLDTNTKAFIVTDTPSDNKVTLVTLAEGNQDIPGNTPVILYTTSTADSHKMTLTAKAGVDDYTGTNLLKVTTAAQDLGAGKCRLGYGANGVGFYKYAVASAPAGIVYLDAAPAQEGKGYTFVFEGETTGISNLNVNDNANIDANAPMYNLAGQRVTKSYKGVVIVNGKKMLNK